MGSEYRVQGSGFKVQRTMYKISAGFREFSPVSRGSAGKRNPSRPEPKGVSFNFGKLFKMVLVHSLESDLARVWDQGTGYRDQGSRNMVQGKGCRVQGSGFGF